MTFAQAPPQTNPGDAPSVTVGLEFTEAAMLAGFEVGVYLSADADVTTADMRVGTYRAAGPGDFAAGPVGFVVTMPNDLSPGAYHLGAIADPANAVAELNERNNTSDPLPVTVVALACTPDAFEVDDLPEQAQLLPPGQAQRRNLCDDRSDWIQVDAQAGTDYRFYVDQEPVALDPHVNIDIFDPAGGKLGAARTASFAWVAPTSGRHLLRVVEDRYGGIFHTDQPYTITLLAPRADLAASKLDPGSGLNAAGTAYVNVEVQNLGGEQAAGFRSVLLLSRDANVTLADTMVGVVASTSLGWKTAIERKIGYQFAVRLDSTVAKGAYYLGWLVDADGAITESDETNNLLVVPVTVR
jgi:hypothetical protein